jgi:hypothetical protein
MFPMRDRKLSLYLDHILRLFRAYEAAMASATIRAAQDSAGFEYEDIDMTTYANRNERKIQEPRDFQDIWMLDYHQTTLSARRQKQQWGWMNADMFRKEERRKLKA